MSVAVPETVNLQSGALPERPLKVLVAASGTGGHLIPALHIIRALQECSPAAVIECVGAGKPLEEKIFVENGFKRHVISSVGIKRRGIIGAVQFLATLPLGVFQCFRLLRRYRPDVVVGVGGYVTVLPIVVARFMGIPTWIHEAELTLGLANRTLARFADRISLSFPETKVAGRAKPVLTGHPVRGELKLVERTTVRPDAPNRLLVLGGSQGARSLDLLTSEIGPLLRDRGVEVVHQSRPENMELVVNSYRAAGVKASVVSFIDDMPGAYDWCDLLISRSGASTVAEVAAVNRPAIFVPYPFQQGTHQSDNARSLSKAGKAFVVEENEPDFIARFRAALESALEPSTYRQMRAAPCEPRGLDAARAIAEGIISLAKA